MLILLVAAFVAGWLAAKMGAYLGPRLFGGARDPKDDRIRSLEADLRVAESNLARSQEETAAKEEELASSQSTVDEYAAMMNDQAAEIERLQFDLRGSVKKTNELREALTDRAEEGMRATVRLKEVETELSVAQAGSELMSNGTLAYDSDDENEVEEDQPIPRDSKVVKFTI